MNQRGLSQAYILLVFGVLVAGVVVFLYNQVNKVTQDENKNTCIFGSQKIEAPFQSAENAFTNTLTEIKAIDKITPGSQTGDARFIYLWIRDNQKVPVFAPADGTLVKIAYKVRIDLGPDMAVPDYDLTFMIDCQTIYQINHLTDLSPEIAALKSNTEPYQIKPGAPINEEDTKPPKNIIVKAGQRLGTTTGTPNAHTFDFGIFVDQSAVCPFAKFKDPLRSEWLALFKGNTCEVSGAY